MKVELRPGLQGRAEAIVDTTNVAVVMGSGDLDVFATPAMIALMEQAACNAILPCLDSSTSSVGIKWTPLMKPPRCLEKNYCYSQTDSR